MARLLFWQRRRDAWAGSESRSPSYKPIFLRLPFLIVFALYICLLLGILEWACRVFPTANSFQDVPQDGPSGGRVVLYSAPLVGRQARQTPAPAAGPSQPRATAPPRIPRRPRTPNAAAVFHRRNGTEDVKETTELSKTNTASESSVAVARSELAPGTGGSDGTSETNGARETGEPSPGVSGAPEASRSATGASVTQLPTTTVSPTQTVVSGVTLMVRPPVTVAGREVHPPEYLDLIILQNSNMTESFNASSSQNFTSSLRRRRPDMSKYGHLSGPTVGVSYYLQYDQAWMRQHVGEGGRYKGAVLGYYQPSIAEADRENGKPCELEEEGMEDQRWGLITCNGPAFVFHDSRCYERWVRAAEIEERIRNKQGDLAWTVVESLDQQWEPKWEGDLVRPCPGGALAASAVPKNPNSEAPPPERVTFRDSNGRDTSTALADLYYAVDPKNGQVTATTTVLRGPSEDRAGLTSVVQYDSRGLPTNTALARVAVITDAHGIPVATTTSFLGRSSSVVTMRNEKGEAIATATILLPPPPRADATGEVTVTVTDQYGRAIATVTGKPTDPGTAPPFFQSPDGERLYIITSSVYWLVLLMPVLLTLICAIFAEMVSSNLRELLPFNAMTREDGATAEESLLMPKGVISGVVNSFQLLFRFKQPVSLLSDLLVLFAAVITTLSTEAVGIKLSGSCRAGDFTGCYMMLGVFLPPTRVVQVLLILSLVCVVATAVILWRWDSGVAAPPGSLMVTGSLMQNARVRDLMRGVRAEDGVRKNISDRSIVSKLEGQRFNLQHYRTPSQRVLTYGIVAKGPRAGLREGLLPREKSKTWVTKTLTKASTFAKITKRPSWATTPAILDWSTYRRRTTDKLLDVCGLLYLAGLMILIVYYNVTVEPNTSFERFVNDQDSGVRVLFTAFGVLLSFFWDYYYARVALMEPYRQLWRRPQAPLKSVAVAPPTTVFVGFWSALARREVFASCVALANILSKFTPPLLSNVPYSPVQTWAFHEFSTWTTIGCLAFLSLVLGYGALFVKYPHMPIDPGSLAGRMYYLCDTDVIHDFQGLSTFNEKEAVKRLDPGWRYRFGKIIGVSGEQRIGVQAHGLAAAKEADGWGRGSSDQEEQDNRTGENNVRKQKAVDLTVGWTDGNINLAGPDTRDWSRKEK